MSTNNSRLWWIVGGAWALLLVGLGTWSAFNSPATVRDQSTVVSGKATIDRVVGQISDKLSEPWRLDDGGYQESTCSITPMRDGKSATRTVTLSGPDGSEQAELVRLADQFDSRIRSSGTQASSLYFDAGNFVAVRARDHGPGVIVVELKTGCRPE
ncbi:hypothetical protein Rhe02_94010 [Rhizocola hellebori]|uniref:Uncharacterized protein n=1 Tax=Rhizocola hellebori TaxID=1392758 RepID=A0A8J3VLC8_9ACTN|nr:hypothetical protein [Rhizocola hellebori]GIH11334.1 hypothetical protein Rhe02_94010 [Rhizocola hellebori]